MASLMEIHRVISEESTGIVYVESPAIKGRKELTAEGIRFLVSLPKDGMVIGKEAHSKYTPQETADYVHTLEQLGLVMNVAGTVYRTELAEKDTRYTKNAPALTPMRVKPSGDLLGPLEIKKLQEYVNEIRAGFGKAQAPSVQPTY